MPTGLQEVDPLIAQLLNRTASEIETAPDNVENWVRHASALLANAYYEESIMASKRALEINPEGRLPLRYRQALALWRLNQQEEAIAQLTSVLEEEPQYDFGWRTLASWYLDRGELELADAAINRAWDIAPDRLGTLTTFVQILLQRDQADQALTLLKPRLGLEDTPRYLYFVASQVYRRLGDIEAMEDAVANGRPIPTDWPDPWRTMISQFATGKKMLAKKAVTAFQTQGGEAALQALTIALRADPTNSQVRGLFAMALIETNKDDQAFVVLEEIPDPDTAVFEYWIAYANFAVKKSNSSDRDTWLQRSMTYFKKAEAISGGSPKLYRSMARLAQQMENPQEASTYFKHASQMLIVDGRLDAAKMILLEGIDANPDDESLKQMLSSLTNAP